MKIVLQFRAAGDDDADIDGAQVEQQAEVVEVAVIEGIFVVPLDFERHPVLVAVHLVGRRVILDLIHHNPRVELLLDPAKLGEMPIELPRDIGLCTARLENVTAEQGETAQHRQDIRPLGGPRRCQNGKPVPPLAHLEALANVVGNKRVIFHVVHDGAVTSTAKAKQMFTVCSLTRFGQSFWSQSNLFLDNVPTMFYS